MSFKPLASASALVLALAMAGTASAQDYNRLISFGDSLSDNGNLYALTGTPPSPPYYMGRFSNGPVWVELLGYNQDGFSDPVGGSINYAFGGAQTDFTALPPGMRNQLGAYLLNGGTFAADDLVTVWGGANNIFNNLAAAGGSPDPLGFIGDASSLAAYDIGAIVNDVSTAGAGTILVGNLPDLAATPQFYGTAAAPLAGAASTAFNTALFAQLQAQASANPNTNIIYFDVHRAFQAITLAPGRFGFTNITDRCFSGGTVCANPDDYAYWDGVHPTAAGHRLLAALANDYIYYRDRGAYSATQAEIGDRNRQHGLDTATERLGYGAFDGVQGGSIYVGALYEDSTLDARGIVPGGDQQTQGLMAGADYTFSDTLRGGAMLSMRQGDVNLGNVEYNAESVGFDVYMGWHSGNMFINGAVGVSADNYDDILRQTALPGVVNTSETNGTTLGAKIEGGYVIGAGNAWQVIPRAGLSWVSSDVDGYVEAGNISPSHVVSDRTIDTLSGEVVLRVQGDLVNDFGIWGEAGYRNAFSHDADEVAIGLAGNTAQHLAFLPEEAAGSQTLLGAGVRGQIGIAEVSVGYRGRIGENYDSHMGGIEVSFRF